MKTQVRKNCTGCHSASYPLQHRFDEEGWNKILDLMKHVNVLGVYPRPDHKPTGNIDFHQKELAAYLARARGPGRNLDEVQAASAPVRRSRARRGSSEYDFPMEGGHARVERRQRLVARHALRDAPRLRRARRADGLQRQHLVHLRPRQPRNHDRQDRRQDRRGEELQARRPARHRHRHPRHHPRRERRDVVQHPLERRARPRRPRPRRSQDREGHRLSAAALDDRNGRHPRRRPERQHLGDVARRRAALQHQGREVHRVQVDDLQEPARHRDGLRPRRRPHRQRLVAADDPGPRRLQRHQDRQDRRAPAAAGEGGDGQPLARAAQVLRHLPAAGLQRAVRLGAGAAPHGRRQERRLRLYRQLVRRHARQDQHPHQGDDARPAAEPGSPSSPIRSRSTRTTTSGPTCGAPTRSRNTIRAASKWTLFDLPTRGHRVALHLVA